MEVWTTKDGKEIPISEMTDQHLINSIRLLERKAIDVWNQELLVAYGSVSTLNGDMAQYYAEQDIRRMEYEGPDPYKYFPKYKHLIKEAGKRGLYWEASYGKEKGIKKYDFTN